MNYSQAILRDYVVNYLTEGVMIIAKTGQILFANDSACTMLGYDAEELLENSFASLFIGTKENDKLVQTVLDSCFYQSERTSTVVPFYSLKENKEMTLRIVSTRMTVEGFEGLVILVLEDLSELYDLRDDLKTLEQIQDLNRKLELRNKLLSDTFGRFLSDEIVNQLLDTPGGLELGGKKQHLTIMMSDLRGFTTISEHMDPEDLISMLNHYFEIMTDVIQKRGGTIIEFIGDGIMVAFGTPVPSDTHAGDAVAAAIEMQARMDEVNVWNLENNYPRLEMGIGIVTGDMVVGNLGCAKRTKYGAVGSCVNICGRIESYTYGNQILISQQTREEVKAPVTIAREIRVMPKGAKDELVLSEVTEIGEPYNVSMNETASQMREPSEPLPICYYKLEAKHELGKPYFGGIVSAGYDTAVLETDSGLELLDNIQFQAGGKLFAKVVEKNGSRYLLHYTHMPAGFQRWYETNIC